MRSSGDDLLSDGGAARRPTGLTDPTVERLRALGVVPLVDGQNLLNLRHWKGPEPRPLHGLKSCKKAASAPNTESFVSQLEGDFSSTSRVIFDQLIRWLTLLIQEP